MTTMREKTWKGVVRRIRGFLGHRPNAMGIDIGSRLTKTIVFQTDLKKATLKDFSIQPTTPIPLPGVQSDPEGPNIQALQDQLAVPLRDVGISISGPQVFLRSLSLPAMTEEDLREHLRLEIDRYIPLDIQDILWDVYHSKTLHLATEEKEENFLVVAKKEYIESRLNVFYQQGVDVCFVDVDAFALVNMVTFNYGSDVSLLLVHLGPTGILAVSIEGGEPSCIREVSYEAEWYGDLLDRVFLPNNLPSSGKELGASEAMLLEQFFTETYSHIIETMQSFSDMSTKPECTPILLSGGYARVPNLSERLTDSLRVPVNLVNPFRAITVPPGIQKDQRFQQAVPLMSVAVGVALRGALLHD